MRRALGIGVILVLAAGCAKRAPATEQPAGAMAPADAAAADGMTGLEAEGAEEPADGLDDLQRQLADLERQLQVRGVELPPAAVEAQDRLEQEEAAAQGATPAAESDPAARCTRICDLAEATCDLQGRICALADDHPTQRQYADVCGRAEDDCARATAACEDCS
jgi:hypothetical protein